MLDRVGQQLGNYRLVRLLGQGGFTEVYLGEHTYLGTHAAIKILYLRITQDDLTQFQQEARMLASLVHPHIIRVLDFGVDGTTPYLVMDYAPGGTLRTHYPTRYLYTGPLDMPLANGLILTSTSQQVPIRVKGNRPNPALMSL